MFLVVREFQLALNFALIANLILMCVCETFALHQLLVERIIGRGLKHFDFRNQLSKFSFGQVIALPLIHYALLSPLTVHIMATLESLNEITHLYIFNSSGDLLIKHIYKVPMQHNKIISLLCCGVLCLLREVFIETEDQNAFSSHHHALPGNQVDPFTYLYLLGLT